MNSEQIANILAYYSYYNPKDDVDQIALDFKLPAALIVNGLYYGDKHHLFTVKKKGPQFKEIVTETPPADETDFGRDLDRIKGIIFEVISNLNTDEEDITDDNLFIWLGVPLIVAKVALQILVNGGLLAKYRITDPNDPKSIYHFYTLIENKDKFYGKKQFKRISKKNVKFDSRKK